MSVIDVYVVVAVVVIVVVVVAVVDVLLLSTMFLHPSRAQTWKKNRNNLKMAGGRKSRRNTILTSNDMIAGSGMMLGLKWLCCVVFNYQEQH